MAPSEATANTAMPTQVHAPVTQRSPRADSGSIDQRGQLVALTTQTECAASDCSRARNVGQGQVPPGWCVEHGQRQPQDDDQHRLAAPVCGRPSLTAVMAAGWRACAHGRPASEGRNAMRRGGWYQHQPDCRQTRQGLPNAQQGPETAAIARIAGPTLVGQCPQPHCQAHIAPSAMPCPPALLLPRRLTLSAMALVLPAAPPRQKTPALTTCRPHPCRRCSRR